MINKEYIEIQELVEAIIDNRGKTVPTSENGIPLIATNCIKHSSIFPTFENIRYINQETYDNWFRAHLKPNDILFVNKGTPGRCCIVPNPVNFVAAQDMVGLRFKKHLNPYYMLAVLRSKEIQNTIENNHVGLVIAHFRKQELVKLKLPILEETIRNKIGDFYEIISKKIELNNRINAELEAMAKTLYDYWFVQFDFPVSDALASTPLSQQSEAGGKRNNVAEHEEIMVAGGERNNLAERKGVMVAESEKNTVAEHEEIMVTEREKNNVVERKGVMVAGCERNNVVESRGVMVAERSRGYKSSGGKMLYNEILKREIPEGWEVKSLYKIADFINGLACQKFRPENENDDYLPVIKIREMNEGKSNNTERVRVNIPEKNIINDGDVLFAWSASLDVKIWTEGKGALNQHIFKVVSKDYPRSFYYFELLNYLKHFKMMAELRKTTMGHITIDHLKTSYISIPPKNLIEKLDKKLDILIERIIINKKQNQELSALRDWLLPMLMNGQVKVGEAEEQVLGIVSKSYASYNRSSQKNDDELFEVWLKEEGLAARGDIDRATLRELFDAMEDEDK